MGAHCGFHRVCCSSPGLYSMRLSREGVFRGASCPGGGRPVIHRRREIRDCLCARLDALEVATKPEAYRCETRHRQRLGPLVAGLLSRPGWECADDVPLEIRRDGGLHGSGSWSGSLTVWKDVQLGTPGLREMAHRTRLVVSEGRRGPRCQCGMPRLSGDCLANLDAERSLPQQVRPCQLDG